MLERNGISRENNKSILQGNVLGSLCVQHGETCIAIPLTTSKGAQTITKIDIDAS